MEHLLCDIPFHLSLKRTSPLASPKDPSVPTKPSQIAHPGTEAVLIPVAGAKDHGNSFALPWFFICTYYIFRRVQSQVSRWILKKLFPFPFFYGKIEKNCVGGQ